MAKAKRTVAETEGGAAVREAGAEAEEAPPRGIVREYFESAVVTVIMALFFMTFVAQAATVPSASMENTIFVGDHFLINKFIFAPGPTVPFLPQREIRRGDVIVFRYPAESIPREEIYQYKTFFIKRVVGLPGETVEVRGSQVFINGRPTPEHRVEARDKLLGHDHAELKDLHPLPRSGEENYSVYYSPETLSYAPDTPPETIARNSNQMQFAVFKPHTLAGDEYFVMGDNRDNSKDSRFWGPVKRDLVVGRAMFVIWSYDESAPKNQTPFVGPVINFFTNSRWGRIGTLIH